ncbi:MAG: hypothetical protein JW880_04180 [Candidatus Thermoplasmatota archaeon]|nr:hypothetical protein [Candidatus Thermoplasmatota archaeon]
MRKIAVTLLSAFVVGLMLAMPASAGTLTMKVADGTGDVGRNSWAHVNDPSQYWADNTAVAKTGYFDMISTWLSQKGKTYTFGMELASVLPEEGSALPIPIKTAEWLLWIDSYPMSAPLYTFSLYYDGSSYSAILLDVSTMVSTPVSFTIDGTKFQVDLSQDLVGDLAGLWWSPAVRLWWGPLGSVGEWIVNLVDFGVAPGQDGVDLPWPPP